METSPPRNKVYVDRYKGEFYINRTVDGQSTYEMFREEDDLLAAIRQMDAIGEPAPQS